MIYLLGSDGFLGSSICTILKKNKIKYIGINKKNYSNYKGKDCDVLINVSTNSKKYLAEKNFKLDFDKTVNHVLNTIRDFRYKKYILISSSDVYNDTNYPKLNKETAYINPSSLTNYGLNKYLAELLVIKHCKNWLIFRCGGLIGNGLKKNPIYDLMNKKKLYVCPQSRFQFISTDDVSEIILKVNKKNINNEIFNLSGIGQVSIKEIINKYKFFPTFGDKTNFVNYNINSKKINKIFKVKKQKTIYLIFLTGVC